MRVRAIAVVAAAIAIAGAAGAETLTPAQQAAERLLIATHMDETFQAMGPKLIEAMLPSLTSGNTGRASELRKIVSEEFGGTILQLLPLMHARSRDLYAQHFTVEELGELARFYASPLGQKATAEGPVIQLEMFKFGQQAGRAAMQAALPRITARMRAANMAVPKGV